MNAPERIVFADIQSQFDSRNVRIDAVGIKGVRQQHLRQIQAGGMA